MKTCAVHTREIHCIHRSFGSVKIYLYVPKSCVAHVSKADSQNDEFEEMTICEIMNGKVIPLVRQFLDSEKAKVEEEAFAKISKYLDFIGERATGRSVGSLLIGPGTLQTNATWIRNFVRNHPDYKHDSQVCHSIVYDLFTTIDKIQKHEIKVLPFFTLRSYSVEDARLYGDFY